MGGKTWSRETAVTLLIFLCYLGYVGSVEVLSILAWPFVIFSMAAFGLKQPAVKDLISARKG